MLNILLFLVVMKFSNCHDMLFIYFEVGQHIKLALHVLLRDLNDDAGDNTLKQEKYSILSILFSNFIFIYFVAYVSKMIPFPLFWFIVTFVRIDYPSIIY